MIRNSRGTASRAAILCLTAALAACAGTGSGPVIATDAGPGHAPESAPPHGAAADVRFMQDMIVHHAQALAMAALVPERTTRADLRMLARRIDASQRDELARMERWLAARGASAPEHGAHTAHAGHSAMPGMASAAQLAQLEAASGAAFERLFLELMIRHHEGALTMVAQLFETPGAGRDPELYRFANDVDADQRAEIARMRRLLASGG